MLTPNDPRYYDPSFNSFGELIPEDDLRCEDCDEEIDQYDIDQSPKGLHLCERCRNDLVWCVYCDEPIRDEEPVNKLHAACQPKWEEEN